MSVPTPYPKLYALAPDFRVTVAEISPSEFTHDGWPLKVENVLNMIADGDLVEAENV